MSERVLKQLTIESYSGYFSRPHYEDKLVVTKNSASYKKEYSGPFRFNEDGSPQLFKNIKWSYKTKLAFHWFVSLQIDIELLEQEERRVLDAGGYSLEATFDDETIIKLHFYDIDEIRNEHIQHIFFLLRKLVPPQEEIPIYMQVSTSVEYDTLKDIIQSLEGNKPYPGDSLKYDFFTKLVEMDFEYNKTMDRILQDNVPIEYLSFDEIRAYITYIVRDEHWDSGAFDIYVKNGIALKIAKRLLNLTYEDTED